MRQVIKRILTIITLERWVLVSEEETPAGEPATAVTLASSARVLEVEPGSVTPAGVPDDDKGDGP